MERPPLRAHVNESSTASQNKRQLHRAAAPICLERQRQGTYSDVSISVDSAMRSCRVERAAFVILKECSLKEWQRYLSRRRSSVVTSVEIMSLREISNRMDSLRALECGSRTRWRPPSAVNANKKWSCEFSTVSATTHTLDDRGAGKSMDTEAPFSSAPRETSLMSRTHPAESEQLHRRRRVSPGWELVSSRPPPNLTAGNHDASGSEPAVRATLSVLLLAARLWKRGTSAKAVIPSITDALHCRACED